MSLEKRVLILSFNTNSNDIPKATLQHLLSSAQVVDIIILSFQEYDLPPCRELPRKPLIFDHDGLHPPATDEAYIRFRAEYPKDRDTQQSQDVERANIIESELGQDFQKIVDCAMGEPDGKFPSTNGGKKLEWYGYVRLVVYIRTGAIQPPGQIHTCVVPCGSKKSANQDAAPYPESESPDKGGVVAWIPELGLLVSSVHLAGTNSNDKQEVEFDAERVGQIETISSAAQLLLERHAGTVQLSVFCGDLNFRVVKYMDRAMFKQELSEVCATAENGSDSEIRDMFASMDRLHLLLTGKSELSCPSFLSGLIDAVGQVNAQNGVNHVIRPTFTYSENSTPPEECTTRSYKQKRTPSWPDRVLFGGEGWKVVSTSNSLFCKSSRQVQCSDHEPLIVQISGPLTTRVRSSRQNWGFLAVCVAFIALFLAKVFGGEELEKRVGGPNDLVRAALLVVLLLYFAWKKFSPFR